MQTRPCPVCHSRSRNAPRRPPPGRTGTELTSGEDAGAGPRAEGYWAEGAHIRLTAQVRTPRTQAWPIRHPGTVCAQTLGMRAPLAWGSRRAAAVWPDPGRPKGAAGEQDTRSALKPSPTSLRKRLTSPRPCSPRHWEQKSQLLAEVTVLAPRACHLRAFAPAVPSPETFLPRPHRTGSAWASPPQRDPLDCAAYRVAPVPSCFCPSARRPDGTVVTAA